MPTQTQLMCSPQTDQTLTYSCYNTILTEASFIAALCTLKLSWTEM